MKAMADDRWMAAKIAELLVDDANPHLSIWVVERVGVPADKLFGRLVGYAHVSGDGGTSFTEYKETGNKQYDQWDHDKMATLLLEPHHNASLGRDG